MYAIVHTHAVREAITTKGWVITLCPVCQWVCECVRPSHNVPSPTGVSVHTALLNNYQRLLYIRTGEGNKDKYDIALCII